MLLAVMSCSGPVKQVPEDPFEGSHSAKDSLGYAVEKGEMGNYEVTQPLPDKLNKTWAGGKVWLMGSLMSQ